MSIDSRSRMISFRLTPEEYESFRQLCFERGMESLSEMARAGLRLIQNQPSGAPAGQLELRVSEIENRLQMLFLEVRKLNASSTAVLDSTSGRSYEAL